MARTSGARGLAIGATLVLVACTGCAVVDDTPAKPPKTTRVKAAAVRVEGGKRTVVSATSRDAGGLFFTRPPYEMNGAWRLSATAGVLDARRVDAVGDTIFGIEADLLPGGGSTPSEFYGLFARHFDTPRRGLQVFASSEDGNHGQVFFDDAVAADLVIETDGATVTFRARDANSSGPFSTVGTRSLQTPSGAHYPGFGMFGAPKGATVGFTDFRVPLNGPLPPGRPAATVALHALYDAAFAVLDAGYALSGPVTETSDVATATDALTRGEAGLADARALIEGLAVATKRGGKSKSPVDVALAAVSKAEREISKSRKRLLKKGPRAARSVVRSITKKMFKSAFSATDALLPESVRETLPGSGLDWKNR